VGLHQDVRVQIYAEISDRVSRDNSVCSYCDGDRRNLMLTTRRGAPEDFGLIGIQLQAVGMHPQGDISNTCRHVGLQLNGLIGLAESVDLSVISVQVWLQAVTLNQTKQIRCQRSPISALFYPLTLKFLPLHYPPSSTSCGYHTLQTFLSSFQCFAHFKQSTHFCFSTELFPHVIAFSNVSATSITLFIRYIQ